MTVSCTSGEPVILFAIQHEPSCEQSQFGLAVDPAPLGGALSAPVPALDPCHMCNLVLTCPCLQSPCTD